MAYALEADIILALSDSSLDGYADSSATIAAYIADVEATVNGRLRSMGFAVPLTAPEDVLVVKGVVVGIVADKMDSVGVEEPAKRRTNDAMATLDAIADGRIQLVSPRRNRIRSVALPTGLDFDVEA